MHTRKMYSTASASSSRCASGAGVGRRADHDVDAGAARASASRASVALRMSSPGPSAAIASLGRASACSARPACLPAWPRFGSGPGPEAESRSGPASRRAIGPCHARSRLAAASSAAAGLSSDPRQEVPSSLTTQSSPGSPPAPPARPARPSATGAVGGTASSAPSSLRKRRRSAWKRPSFAACRVSACQGWRGRRGGRRGGRREQRLPASVARPSGGRPSCRTLASRRARRRARPLAVGQ